MNKECAKYCVISSVIATLFMGVGFGIMMAHHPLVTIKPFAGLIIAAMGFVGTFGLLGLVERAGYKCRVVTREVENDN